MSSISDELIHRDPTAGYRIRLDLCDPMGRVSNSKWHPVPILWIGDDWIRGETDWELLAKQAIADAGSLNGVKPKGSEDE